MGANAMNACKKTQALLFESADGRTAPEVQADVQAHLEVCVHCQQIFATWTGALPRLRGLPIDELSALAERRMENEILRQVAVKPPRRPWRPLGFALAAGLIVAVGIGAVALRFSTPPPLARIQTLWGHVTLSGAAMTPGATMAEGGTLEIADQGEAAFVVGRQAGVRLQGPGRVALIGTSRHPRLRLDSGRLSVQISHRQADETFMVATAHGHIEVRGTRFVIGYAGQGSFVHVEDGEVAAYRRGVPEPFSVKAGETFPLVPEPQQAPAEAPAAKPEPRPCPPSSCSDSAGQARKAMRIGNPARAVDLVDEALGESRHCPVEPRCQDELGYLRAEALRQAGRTEAAVAAYRSLNRSGTTRAMRQNALYAAGLLERSLGRDEDAQQSFKQALAANPDGALAEESLAGLMDSAKPGSAQARATAERYLHRYPHGVAAARARRILSEAPGAR
jgi:ferric-dicitrate binding protein FerR (iron transport regulator)